MRSVSTEYGLSGIAQHSVVLDPDLIERGPLNSIKNDPLPRAIVHTIRNTLVIPRQLRNDRLPRFASHASPRINHIDSRYRVSRTEPVAHISKKFPVRAKPAVVDS